MNEYQWDRFLASTFFGTSSHALVFLITVLLSLSHQFQRDERVMLLDNLYLAAQLISIYNGEATQASLESRLLNRWSPVAATELQIYASA